MHRPRRSTLSAAALAVALVYLGACVRLIGTTPNARDDGGAGAPVALIVEPVYPGAPNWMDHIRRSKPDLPSYGQPEALCDPVADSQIGACVHAGELRMVRTTLTSCTGLSVKDALDALQWRCDDTDGAAVIYSTGLREEASLGHLLQAGGFKPNHVVVQQGAGGPVLKSASAVWWKNPVKPLPPSDSADPVKLQGAGTIYTVSADTSANGYEIADDKVAVVVLPGVTLTLRDGADNCAVISGQYYHRCLLAASARRFVWIEGHLHGAGGADAFGIRAVDLHYLRLRRVQADSFWHSGLGLEEIQTSRLEWVTANNNGLFGVNIAAINTVLSRISAFGNGRSQGNSGLILDGASSHNVVTRLTAASNHENGALLFGSSGSNTVGFATLAHNSFAGVAIQGEGQNTLFQLLGLRAGTGGCGFTSTSPGNRVAQSAFGHNHFGVAVGTNAVTLSHDIVMAGNTVDCHAKGADVSCSTLGGTLRLFKVPDMTKVVLGKVSTDDTANLSDSGGAALRGQIDDWTGFESRLRGWGADGIDALGHVSNAGPCLTKCRIWDWHLGPDANTWLRVRDTTGKPSSASVEQGKPCPAAASGDVTLTDKSGNTFLLHALELMADGLGDDDGLCESNEACVYRPHPGDDGHGARPGSARCGFSDGAVMGVRMFGLVN
jgi:hypothetical protein